MYIYMEFVNKNNSQFIQDKIASKEGTRCQAGGGQVHELSTSSSYGYVDANGFKTSGYPPITSGVTKHTQCGGKSRKKRKRRRKNKSRKSRKRRRTKHKRRRRSKKAGHCGTCGQNKRKRKSKTLKKKKRKHKRRQRGGYNQFGNNTPFTPSYTFKHTTETPWALGPNSISRDPNKC